MHPGCGTLGCYWGAGSAGVAQHHGQDEPQPACPSVGTLMRPDWMHGQLLGWTDRGMGTGEGFVAAWGPPHPRGGSANLALCQARWPSVVPDSGAGHRCCFWSRWCAAEPSAGMGLGVCHDAAPALGLPWCFQLPGERQKAGEKNYNNNDKKLQSRANSKIKAADCLPNKNRTQQRAHIGWYHSFPRC